MNEIKIAEIVQMTCEEAEETSFVLLCQEGEVRADVVEVECELDQEVAQLTGAGPADDADLPDLDTFQVGSWVSDLAPSTTAPAILFWKCLFSLLVIGAVILIGQRRLLEAKQHTHTTLYLLDTDRP